MRSKIFFIAGIMGIAVISGIIKGLSSGRVSAKKEEEENAGDKPAHSAKNAGPCQLSDP